MLTERASRSISLVKSSSLKLLKKCFGPKTYFQFVNNEYRKHIICSMQQKTKTMLYVLLTRGLEVLWLFNGITVLWREKKKTSAILKQFLNLTGWWIVWLNVTVFIQYYSRSAEPKQLYVPSSIILSQIQSEQCVRLHTRTVLKV